MTHDIQASATSAGTRGIQLNGTRQTVRITPTVRMILQLGEDA